MKLKSTGTILYALFCLIFGCLSLQGAAQKDYELPKTREVIVNTGDSVVKANILYEPQKSIRTKDDRAYYWYAANEIHRNKGGYEGKLLYNDYKVFNEDNQLVLKGTFKKGLKDGKWIEWYPNGKIRSITHWKKGLQSGRYLSYDEEEKLLERSTFRRGVKKGKGKEFDGKSDYNKVKYVDLKEVPPQKGPPGVKKSRKEKKMEKAADKKKAASSKNKDRKTRDKKLKNDPTAKEKKKKEKEKKTTKN